jgi:hypothetical protein
MKFNDRLFLSIAMLAQNPVAFGFALVMVPVLLVFAAYVAFEIGMYVALPTLAVVLVLKLANAFLKPKHRYVQRPLVRLPQTPELPPVSQPLLKGPQRW